MDRKCSLREDGSSRLWAPAGEVRAWPRALTASWRSSRADSAEWPPGSACRLGPRRGRSRSSESAAPAAQTPAPAASASPAGPRVGPAAAAGAPGPAGSHSGPGLGPDGCPATLRRAESLSAAGSQHPRSPLGPPRGPAQPKPSRMLTAHNAPGGQGPERALWGQPSLGPHQFLCRLWDVPR